MYVFADAKSSRCLPAAVGLMDGRDGTRAVQVNRILIGRRRSLFACRRGINAGMHHVTANHRAKPVAIGVNRHLHFGLGCLARAFRLG